MKQRLPEGTWISCPLVRFFLGLSITIVINWQICVMKGKEIITRFCVEFG